MIAMRVVTRGAYPIGRGRGLLTRGLAPPPSEYTATGITIPKVEKSTVALLDGLSGWAAPASDWTVVELYATAPENLLSTPHMLNLLSQVDQRRTGHGAKLDDVVRVRWSKTDGSGEDEAVFVWH